MERIKIGLVGTSQLSFPATRKARSGEEPKGWGVWRKRWALS